MFNILDMYLMAGTYEQRKVDNYKCDRFNLDTVHITDRNFSFETAVIYQGFNDNEWIVLEYADSYEEAQKVHDKWLEYFKTNIPDELTDVYTSEKFKRKVQNNEQS